MSLVQSGQKGERGRSFEPKWTVMGHSRRSMFELFGLFDCSSCSPIFINFTVRCSVDPGVNKPWSQMVQLEVLLHVESENMIMNLKQKFCFFFGGYKLIVFSLMHYSCKTYGERVRSSGRKTVHLTLKSSKYRVRFIIAAWWFSLNRSLDAKSIIGSDDYSDSIKFSE